MHAQNIFIGSRFRLNKIGFLRDPPGQQSIMNQSEFLRRKYVGTKLQIILRVIDELEREHL